MTLIRGQGRLAQKDQASKAPSAPLSNRSNNGDHEDPLKSNKSGPFESPTRPKALTGPEAPAGPPQVLLPVFQDRGTN